MNSWSELPIKARVFISIVYLAAIPLFLLALPDFYQITLREAFVHHTNYLGLLLAAIALIAAQAFVYLPSVRHLITIGDAFIISICMINGRSAAVVVNAIYISYISILLRQKEKSPTYRLVFNVAMAIVNVSLYGTVYQFLISTPKPPYPNTLDVILLPAFCIGLTFYLSNSIFVAAAIGLSSGQRITEIWRKNYPRLSLDFLVSASAATLIVWAGSIHKLLTLLVAPIVAAMWALQKINRAKAIDAETHLREQEQLYLRTVESLALAVDAKDQTTYGHIRRVRAYSMGLAGLCGVTDQDELRAIETGSLLHDIGKLAIDDYILNKPGPLSKQEYEKMKVHSAAGDEILQLIQFPFPVARYVRCHHECWNGKGYPDGLRREEIPLGARILAIADAFDAIRSTRPYKLSANTQESVQVLRSQSGIRYDPNLVEIFVEHIDELEEAADEAGRNMTELSFRKYFEKFDSALAKDTSCISSGIPSNSASNELVRLSEFCSSLGKQLDFQDCLPILARRLEKFLPFSTCVFYLDSNEGGIRAEHVGGKFSELLRGFGMPLGKGISGWVAAYSRPMLNARPALEFQGMGEEVCSLADSVIVPLTIEGQNLGVLSLYAESPISYNQTHLQLLKMAASVIAPLIADLQANRGDFSNADELDPVTRTHHVSYLSLVAPRLFASAEQNQTPLSLLALDLYNLRQIVNLYGSGVADSLMKKSAEVVRTELRETDVIVRYGNQGFMALLPGVRVEQAARCSSRLQQQIRGTPISELPGHTVFAGCRGAVAGFPGEGSTIQDLILAAQRALADQAKSPSTSEAALSANVVEFPPRA